MSALAAEYIDVNGQAESRYAQSAVPAQRSRGRRAHLRVVPDASSLRKEQMLTAARPVAPMRRPVSPVARPAAPMKLRIVELKSVAGENRSYTEPILTPTMRSILTAVIAGALIVFVFALGLYLAATLGFMPEASMSVTVAPGDTAWSIATEHFAGMDPRVVVADIENLNGINATDIAAGEELLLPRY